MDLLNAFIVSSKLPLILIPTRGGIFFPLHCFVFKQQRIPLLVLTSFCISCLSSLTLSTTLWWSQLTALNSVCFALFHMHLNDFMATSIIIRRASWSNFCLEEAVNFTDLKNPSNKPPQAHKHLGVFVWFHRQMTFLAFKKGTFLFTKGSAKNSLARKLLNDMSREMGCSSEVLH